MSQSKFFKAISRKDIKALRKSIKEGVNIDAVDPSSYFGDTALIRAADTGRTDIVKELLLAGASVDLSNFSGDTPLIDAARYGCTEVVKVLLGAGATVDQKKKDGTTALISAARCGCTNAIIELLSFGATVDLANNNGVTALMMARESPHSNPETICLLEEAERKKAASDAHHLTNRGVPQRCVSTPVLLHSNTAKEMLQRKRSLKKVNGRMTLSRSEDPLMQDSSYPDVTFYGKPKEEVITPSGGHFDYDNGVELDVPDHVIPSETTYSVSVRASLASTEVFEMPPGIHSASPSYLVSGNGPELERDLILSMEHHVKVGNEDTGDLLFLQADSSPKQSDSKAVYEYREVPETRSEFKTGENKGRLTIARRLSRKFFKIGLRTRKKRRSDSSDSSGATKSTNAKESPAHTEAEHAHVNPNLYTVRVYRSPPQTTGEKIAIVGVSLYGRLYSKFLKELDEVIIPRDYPEVSMKVADRTIFEPLSLEELQATLNVVHTPAGWNVNLDKPTISKRAIDFPETGHYRPEELQNYPPKIVCRFYPDEGCQEKTITCILSLTGFDEEVKVHVPLKTVSQAQVQRSVDTRKLQEVTERLKTSVIRVKETPLGSTVETIVALMERMTTALRLSSSLEDLAVHTDSIKKEVQTVLIVSRKVAKECSIQTLKDNIEGSMSQIEVLTPQLCQLVKVKQNYCRDQSEEEVALDDLVNCGANLLRAVDFLLKDISTLNGISKDNSAHKVLVECSEKIVTRLSLEPKALALSLLSAGFISERTLDEINQLPEINHDKGVRLYTAVLGTVKSHPQKYPEFISILKQNETLYKDLLMELDLMTYQERLT